MAFFNVIEASGQAADYPGGCMHVAPRLHVSVLSDEVLHWLDPRPGQTFVDGTLGAGGHARALAQRVGSSGLVIALDRDPAALAAAEQNLAGLPIAIAQANFCDLAEVLAEVGLTTVDGILLDLGLSSDQLADPERGFSFDSPGPLDLRFDVEAGEPAWRLLERLDAEDLADILFRFGQERFSRRIARRIVEQRKTEPIKTAVQLAQLVRRAIPLTTDTRRIDAATRTFQALRIAVNGELDSLELALGGLPDLLAADGRLAIISFHSLEDRLVKEAFRGDPRLTQLTKKPVRPGDDGDRPSNPASRAAAKMRVASLRAGSQENFRAAVQRRRPGGGESFFSRQPHGACIDREGRWQAAERELPFRRFAPFGSYAARNHFAAVATPNRAEQPPRCWFG